MTDDTRLTRLAATLTSTVPFVGPEAIERASGTLFDARLGANESSFGPSPLAIKAMQDMAPNVWMYADSESHNLRAALADHHGINPANIMIGEGIDALLGLLVRLLITHGDHAVTSAGAYPTFNYHVGGFGGKLHTVPYMGNHEDPFRLITKAKETCAKLIYIANPDNPMGTYHKAPKIERMIEAVPNGCLLILDEAYIELAPKDATPAISPDDPRVIRMRTFSKGYGMAGARVGYAVGDPYLINSFNKVRNHFGMNRISQAGALAALADETYLGDVIAHVQKSRDQIATIALDNGLTPIPSATNFVTINCGLDGGFAKRVVTELGKLGVFVRMPFVSPQNHCIRVSCGPRSALNHFAKALPKALNAAHE